MFQDSTAGTFSAASCFPPARLLISDSSLRVTAAVTCNALSLLQGRLFLTRDTKLAARRDVGGSVYLLATDDAAEQLTEISRHFGIR